MRGLIGLSLRASMAVLIGAFDDKVVLLKCWNNELCGTRGAGLP